MTIHDRINAFIKLGEKIETFIQNNFESADSELLRLKKSLDNAHLKNQWFTSLFCITALKSIINLLDKKKLNRWISKYSFGTEPLLTIGVVMAGNIPLVGFHDFLCVLISGNKFMGKLSSKDDSLLEIISNILIEIEPGFENRITFQDQPLKNFHAVIATGSNNSSRYFEYYFGKYPNIIRKNRNSIALLTGQESESELIKLSDDVFTYFGLGCRNVSKLFVPKDFNFELLIKIFGKYQYFKSHSGFMNNYDYNKSIYLVNSIEFIDGGFFLLTENQTIFSPIAVLHYEYYDSLSEIETSIISQKENIQVIVCNDNKDSKVNFGKAQLPETWDYADNIDTLSFLLNLN